MAYFGLLPSRWIGLLFIAPLLIDGGTQQMGYRISNNSLRVITGCLAGVGLGVFILLWIERDLSILGRFLK